MQGIEDTSVLEDLTEAEEEYDRPEQVAYIFDFCRLTRRKFASCICGSAAAYKSCIPSMLSATECYGQAFNEAGIAFEPFHLKKEREEGYFDPDGNYIQYKLDEVKDAWLDSLADGTV